MTKFLEILLVALFVLMFSLVIAAMQFHDEKVEQTDNERTCQIVQGDATHEMPCHIVNEKYAEVR